MLLKLIKIIYYKILLILLLSSCLGSGPHFRVNERGKVYNYNRKVINAENN